MGLRLLSLYSPCDSGRPALCPTAPGQGFPAAPSSLLHLVFVCRSWTPQMDAFCLGPSAPRAGMGCGLGLLEKTQNVQLNLNFRQINLFFFYLSISSSETLHRMYNFTCYIWQP